MVRKPTTKKSSSSTVKRIGIFGGAFSPVHLGHVNSVREVLQKMKLDEVQVIPAYVSPGRQMTDSPSPHHRYEMTKLAFKELGDRVYVNDFEIKKGGISYTVETLTQLRVDLSPCELFLIVGLDQFENFSTWKDYRDILDMAELVVTSRPDGHLPRNEEELPPELRPLVLDFHEDHLDMLKGKTIHMVQLSDMQVSSSEIRKRLLQKQSCSGLLAPAVEEYIQENELYSGVRKKIGDFDRFTRFCGDQLFARKGIQVTGYDVREIGQPSEYTLIASGTSTRHATSLAENVIREVKTNFGVFPQSIEGLQEGRWVVLDYGSLIIHVFYDFARQEYRLEDLWRSGKNMNLVDKVENKVKSLSTP